MEEIELNKALDELIKPTEAPEAAARENIIEGEKVNSPESIVPRLPPEGQAWFNGLNPFCRWAVEYDLRTAPDSFVEHWENLRDTLQKLERDFGPSDNWK
jgi:hypothetical protein